MFCFIQANVLFAQAELGENEQLIKGYFIGKGWRWLGGYEQQDGPMKGWRLVKTQGEGQTITICLDKKGICQTQFHEFDTEQAYMIRRDMVERNYTRTNESDKWIRSYREFNRNVLAEQKCTSTSRGSYSCFFIFTFDRSL